MAWYAVYTKSRCEDKVHNGLLQRSVEVYLPKIEVWSKRKDRKKRIAIPMFSGYLFIESPDLTNEKKLDILTTPGVVKILGKPNSSEPFPVPDSQINAVQRLTASGIEIQACFYPKAGDRARIISGPFTGIEGIVLQTDVQKNLFVVSIDLLKRSVAIKLEGFQVERV
ncbi:MAG: UpxY family transcription antiterminator [Syntrophales bacterium]|jgi:transcription antitermination factor NusG|nr:UpxY family transcription antiterminator [Syntrophales bacterium]MDY0043754.1 UpxY family transcription antiterminator [Syntrophales bacterium]